MIGDEKKVEGHAVIEKLWFDMGYLNTSRYQRYDERNRINWEIGFDTNAKTKGLAMNNIDN